MTSGMVVPTPLNRIAFLEAQSHQDHAVIESLKRRLQDLEQFVRQVDVATYDGKFVFRITEASKLIQKAKDGTACSVLSAVFGFPHKAGYRFCLRVYLNGDGAHYNKSVGVYVCLMQGEFDALMSWPCQLIICLSLEDIHGMAHVEKTFAADGADNQYFQRPMRSLMPGVGTPSICGVAELGPYISPLDEIYIRCQIASPTTKQYNQFFKKV